MDDPTDWVRIEIETARSLGLTIIPLLVEGARMPKAAELPDALRDLAQINGVAVRDDPDFARDMERVLTAIQRVFATRPTSGGLPAPFGQRGGVVPQVSTPPAGNRPPSGWAGAPLPAGGGRGGPGAQVAVPVRQTGAKPRRRPWLIGSGMTVVLVITIVLVVTRVISGTGPWSSVSSPTNSLLSSVAMVSASEGWAVGDSETILHYSGGQWSSVSSPRFTTLHLNSVAMASASDGWAVGGNGTILHYSGGQ